VSLVDTSVWVDHLRRGHAALAARLREGVVCTHPFVIGELACGHLARRREVLALLDALPRLPAVSHHEAMVFVEARRLAGQGIGWIDVHLLASAAVGGARVWTLDRRLHTVARRLGLAVEDRHEEGT
jgi:predicted nucleic acid-binding protein